MINKNERGPTMKKVNYIALAAIVFFLRIHSPATRHPPEAYGAEALCAAAEAAA
jgi:hypothetical protein